jgi:hypothetical protein
MPINPLQLPSSQAFTPDITPTLANLVNNINQGQERAFQRQTLADIGKGIAGGTLTYDQAAGKLLAAGDRQGALSLAQLGMNQANQAYQHGRDATNDQFRRDEAARSQGNTDRMIAIQTANANKPVYKTQKDLNGNETIVRINPDGSSAPVNAGVQGQQQPNNPFAYGKQNENQSKDSGYANRLFRAEGILRDPKAVDAAKSPYQRGLDSLPMGIGNYMQSSEYQKYDQASRDFINGVLRRESGAAISQSEFDNAYRQYLPRPGDSKEVLAEKQRNRQEAIAGIAGGGGQSYRPPFTFGQNGELVPNEQKPSVARGSGITQEQYAALPPGTPYTAPDGSQRIKR